MVAVDTRESVAIASGVRDIEQATPVRVVGRAHLAGRERRVKWRRGRWEWDAAWLIAIITAYHRYAD
jgi:hypothetical protein